MVLKDFWKQGVVVHAYSPKVGKLSQEDHDSTQAGAI